MQCSVAWTCNQHARAEYLIGGRFMFSSPLSSAAERSASGQGFRGSRPLTRRAPIHPSQTLDTPASLSEKIPLDAPSPPCTLLWIQTSG